MEWNQVLTIIISIVGINGSLVAGIFFVLRKDIKEVRSEIKDVRGEIKDVRSEIKQSEERTLQVIQQSEQRTVDMIQQSERRLGARIDKLDFKTQQDIAASEKRQDKLRIAELLPIERQVSNHIPTQISELKHQVDDLRDVVIPTKIGELQHQIEEIRDVVIPTKIGELRDALVPQITEVQHQMRELRDIVIKYIVKDTQHDSSEPIQPDESSAKHKPIPDSS